MTFVFIGDIHIEKRTVEPFNHPSRYDKQVEACLDTLEQVFKWCRQNGVTEVLQGGDLFDNPFPMQRSIEALLDLLNRYKDIKFIVMPGNHDLASHAEHSLGVMSWIGKRDMLPLQVIMQPTMMKIDGNDCWVCPHPFIWEPKKKADWCIGHFPWKGAKRDNGSIQDSGSSPKGNWLLADFHTYQEGDRFTYAGSLNQLSRLEQGPKGFLAIDGKKKRFIPVKQPYQISTIRIDKAGQLDKLVGQEPDGTPIWWWVYLNNPDVAMPGDWAIRYPHVLDYTPFRLTEQRQDTTTDIISFTNDPEEGLEEWVANRLRLDKGINIKKEVKRLTKLVKALKRREK